MFNGTLRELYRSGKMSNSSIYHDALYQTITACELLKKHGWKHNDIHNKTSKLIKYKWFLIDYGMLHYNTLFFI